MHIYISTHRAARLLPSVESGLGLSSRNHYIYEPMLYSSAAAISEPMLHCSTAAIYEPMLHCLNL